MDIIRKEIKFFVIVISHVEVSHEMAFYLLLYKNVSLHLRTPAIGHACLEIPLFSRRFQSCTRVRWRF